MSQVSRRRIRQAIDTSKFDAPQDLLTSTTSKLWNGSPSQFEIGLFYGKTSLITDLSNLTELTHQIKASVNGGVPAEDAAVLATKTVSSFDATLAADTWTDGSKQHALFQYTGAELKLGTGDFWQILVATIAGESEPITLAAGPIKIIGDGYENGAGSAPDPVESYLNTAQSDARYSAMGITSADYRSTFAGLTGGTATDLDSIVTATLATGYLVAVIIAGALRFYRLEAGTDAEASPGTIRPDDYAGSTNEKIWKQVL